MHSVLFLCTANSARSLLAEAALRRWGAGRFRAFSAGSQPADAPHPMTLDVLRSLGQASEGMRSKSFREFAAPGAPELHFVITVCDNAASEACPLWPGRPVSAHWGVPDPAVFEGSEVEKLAVFRDTYVALEARVKALVRLDLAALDPESLAERLRAIGAEEPLR